MRPFLAHVAAAAIATLAACGPVGAEKLTADPNNAIVQEQPPAPATDQRLSRKVKYEAVGKPVAAILDDLAQQTGVPFRAGYNKSDWQVRDRKMSVFSGDAQLSDLMDSIARVMKFKWRSEKMSGQLVYRLYMDRRTLLDADARKAREEERLAKLEADRRRRALDSFADLAKLSSQEAARLRNTNPYKYYLATSGLARSFSSFLSGASAVTEALANGEPLAVQGDALSDRSKRALLETMRELSKAAYYGPGDPAPQISADANPDDVMISVNGNLSDVKYFYNESPAVLGSMDLVLGDVEIPVELLDPDSDYAKRVGEVMIAMAEDGKNPDEAEAEARDRLYEALVADGNKDAPDETSAERPDSPALHKKVTLKITSSKLPDIQSAISKASGLAVVSDFFTRTAGLPVPANTETELADLLDTVGSAFKYDWDEHGSVIEFRDKRWFQKRAAQIPQAWIDKWRKKFKEAGILDLDDLAQIVALTDEQFKENIAEDDLLKRSGAPEMFRLARGVIKLYGSLGPAERIALFTEDGLGLESLSAEQLGLLREMMSLHNPLFLQRDPASLTLTASRLRFPHKLRYLFTIAGNEDHEQIVQTMDVPKYQETEDCAEDQQ